MEQIFRLLILMLVLTFGAGCTSLRSEAPVSSEIQIQEEAENRINFLRDVSVSTLRDQIQVHIETAQKPTYTAIKQNFPLGVAVYLPETVIPPDFAVSSMPGDPIQSIRAKYADQTETTARIDVLMNQDLPYEVMEETRGLRLVFINPQLNPRICQHQGLT